MAENQQDAALAARGLATTRAHAGSTGAEEVGAGGARAVRQCPSSEAR